MSSKSIPDKLLEAADMASTVKAGLQVIERLAGTDHLGGDVGKKADLAIDALKTIAEVSRVLHKGLGGELDASAILAELNKLKTGIMANDANADSELDKKFPTG